MGIQHHEATKSIKGCHSPEHHWCTLVYKVEIKWLGLGPVLQCVPSTQEALGPIPAL